MSLCFTKKNSAVTDDTSHGEIVVSTEGLCPGHVWYYSLPFWLPTYGRWIFSKNSNFQPICKNFKFYIFSFCYLTHGLWFYQFETCTNKTGVLNVFKKSFFRVLCTKMSVTYVTHYIYETEPKTVVLRKIGICFISFSVSFIWLY